MTWGKALLQWTANARDALALLLDLNHRYALDGRDPASYGGILWCLGALDRPFTPESPILGKVRPRPLAEQAKRLDVGEYSRKSRQPSRGAPLVVAVVGAGVAGAAAARALRDAGHVVRAFDKGRGPGGRCATRRDEDGGTFDHGAQYLTARDERFLRVVRSLVEEGVLARWEPSPKVLPEASAAPGTSAPRGAAPGHEGKAGQKPRPAERYVGVGGMNELLKRLLRDTEVRYGTQVHRLERVDQRFRLHGEAGPLGEFDAVVVTAPAPQTQALLGPVDPALAARAGEAVLAPCWSVMATFPGPLPVALESAFLNEGPLGFVARQAGRPGQAPGERWVLQATAAWSAEHLERDGADVAALLCEAFGRALGVALEAPRTLVAHRWRFARVERPLGAACLWNPELQLAAAGDWCLGERIEDAFLSGCAAAGRLNQLPGEARTEEPAPERRAAQLLLGLG
jgi:predicted NAD/FAD-dependent oxidoreductase